MLLPWRDPVILDAVEEAGGWPYVAVRAFAGALVLLLLFAGLGSMFVLIEAMLR